MASPSVTDRGAPVVWDGFTLAIAALAVVYTSLAWTPSSYGVQLADFGLPGAGLVAGEPQKIRSDEWGRWTPFVQVAVNNGFRRFNDTSPYREDLRNVEGLPLRDWGLAFKPYHLPFFVVDPAHAFSFYHAFWIAAFLIGYHHLFRRLDLPTGLAALASVTLFFSAFVQLWWTTYGPVVSGFPWVLLAALMRVRSRRGAVLKVAVLAWTITAWALANLYPPIMITLAFVAAVVVAAFDRELLRPRALIPSVLGTALGAGLVFAYYRDVFFIMAGTVYPGRRLSAGGGPVPPTQWMAHLFPSFVTDGFHNLVNYNICEAATVGSLVPILALCFGDLRALVSAPKAEESRRGIGWRLAVVVVGVLATTAWLLLPFPPAAGLPLLWHRVPGFRMWFACGLLIFITALTVLRAVPVRLTWPRFTIFAGAALGAWIVAARIFPAGARRTWEDLWVLAPLAIVVALRARIGRAAKAALLTVAAAANLAAFGTFNPIQSAKPIFHRAATPVTAALDRLASRHPRGWLVMEGGYGAVLNGLGYASVSHLLYAPEPGFFRALFSGMPPDEFDFMFNRTAYISLWPRDSARLNGDYEITLPIELFDPPGIAVEIVDSPVTVGGGGGAEESRSVHVDPSGAHLTIAGWGMFDASRPEARIAVLTHLPVRAARAFPALRPDVAARTAKPGLAMSGFILVLDVDVEVSPGATSGNVAGVTEDELRRLAARPLCLVTIDPERGAVALPGACARASSSDPAGG